MSPAQRQWIDAKQERLRVTSALVDDIKAVKMQGLSQTMAAIIADLRRSEIRISETYRKLLVIMVLLCKLASMHLCVYNKTD
jgi:ATP-binding cassette subfamily C (CFTR/MRP) protein 1